MSNGKIKKRKVWQIIGIVLVAIIFILLLITLVTFNNTDSNQILFGYSYFSVVSESMLPVFDTDDIIVIRAVRPNRRPPDYQINDIVTYQSFDLNNLGVFITHRIVDITEDGRYITKGDNNEVVDPLPIYASQILGKYQYRIKGARVFMLFLRSPYGYVLFILVPSLLLIGFEIVLFIGYFKKFRVSYKERSEKEKQRLETEIQENKKLREELSRLKEELISIKETEKNEQAND